jgi:hypothetical protein
MTVAFLASAICSIAVGREKEATVWKRTPVIATAAKAESRRTVREVRFMSVLGGCIRGCVWGDDTVWLKVLRRP